jgi:hypothetical protein
VRLASKFIVYLLQVPNEQNNSSFTRSANNHSQDVHDSFPHTVLLPAGLSISGFLAGSSPVHLAGASAPAITRLPREGSVPARRESRLLAVGSKFGASRM